MPRFSIKDLFLATTLVAIGAGLNYYFGILGPRPLPFAVTLLIWLSVGPIIGAGLGILFKKIKTGAGLGFVAWIAFWFSALYLGWL